MRSKVRSSGRRTREIASYMGTVPTGTGEAFDDGLANFGDVAAGGEVHHGVGAVVDGVMELFQLFVDVGGGGGIADVGVDFAAGGDADGHGLEIAVVDVGGDDAAAAGDFAADDFGIEFFALGDVLHFFGDDALAGEMHLRHVAVAVGAGLGGFARFDPGVSHCHGGAPREARESCFVFRDY